MEPLFMMDGITVQHAGELLFDASATVRQRAECAATYLRCLEDVAFSLVFGQGFLVTRNLPRVGDETPGADLCAHFEHSIRPVEEARTAPPDALVASRTGVRAVAEWLGGLRYLKTKDHQYWREFALRESDAYLWPQGEEARRNLIRPDVPIDQLTFGKNYWIVPDLQCLVPDALTDLLVRDILHHHPLPERNAAEFVRRSIVAHAVIFEWYQRRLKHGVAPGVGLTHLPHVTRTTFLAEERIDREMWRLGRLVMPRLLGEILRQCDRRDDVLKRTEDLLADGRLEPLRHRLRAAVLTQDVRELEGIRRDIEQSLDGQASCAPVDIAVKAGFVGPVPKAEVEVRRRLDEAEDEYEAAIRFVLRRSPDDRAEERAQAMRVFPELRPSTSASAS